MGMLRRKIDNFYLVEVIGSGGMADVYLAINPRTKEKRAVKIMKKCATTLSEAYARFLREVEIIRSLSHPGIVRIMESGMLEDCYYYFMEFVPGGNLSKRLASRKIPTDQALKLFIGVCDAMAYAHEKGIIHRDLKPSNILLTSDGEPVLSDFGIAKILNSEGSAITRSSEIMGTIAYLAPEQRFNTRGVDRRADIYALGAIFYEMLMGFPPLGKFPWPMDIHPDFPEPLQDILEKCLGIDPLSRYANAGLLHLELKRFQELSNKGETDGAGISLIKNYVAGEDKSAPVLKTDRIEAWFQILRGGTTRERLGIVREMVDKMESREAKAILKLYSGEGDRVRWGLIRVLGELKIAAATSLILSDLNNPFHTECAIEALGKIGSDEAYEPIRQYIIDNPDSVIIALVPLARTGKERAIKFISQYLESEMAVIRQVAVHALASIASNESLQLLKDHLYRERDEKVRSHIFQSVHSLEAAMLPSIGDRNRNTEILPAIKSKVSTPA